MAKRTIETDTKLHTSTSESVKTRPRKKRGTSLTRDSGTNNTRPKRTPKSRKVKEEPVEILSYPQAFQPLAIAHLNELTTIWDVDKRIPSVASRRAWALARNVKPEHIHRWWWRRKQAAKKDRIKLPKGTYELPVGTPPIIEIIIKDEPEEMSSEPPGKSPKIMKSEPPDPGPSTSLSSGETIINSEGVIRASSSGTLVSTSPLARKSAYSPCTSRVLRSSGLLASSRLSPLPPSSPPASPSPCPPSPQICLRMVSIEPETPDILQDWCSQGLDNLSEYTCSLCSVPLHPDSELSNSSELFGSDIDWITQDPRYAHIALPLTPESLPLMELSAIPFLSSSDVPAPQTALPTYPRVFTNYSCGCAPTLHLCLRGNSYAYDGSFIGRCGFPKGEEFWDIIMDKELPDLEPTQILNSGDLDSLFYANLNKTDSVSRGHEL